jgi:hypothetical protein
MVPRCRCGHQYRTISTSTAIGLLNAAVVACQRAAISTLPIFRHCCGPSNIRFNAEDEVIPLNRAAMRSGSFFVFVSFRAEPSDLRVDLNQSGGPISHSIKKKIVCMPQWMEATMSTHAAVKTLLTRLRERWRARNEFASMDQNECDHLAREFGMTAKDLETLVRRGPNAANLLYERMRALGMSVEHVGHGLMRDLEKTCALCDDKGVCKKDLARKSHDFRW